MAATTISMEQLHCNPAAAEQAAKQGPVFVADSGKTTLVLLDAEHYRRLGGIIPAEQQAGNSDPATKPFRSLADIFSVPGLRQEDVDVEFERLDWTFPPADLS